MDIATIQSGFDQLKYVLDEELATVLFLMQKLEKPLLLEGNPGVGKTDVANHLASLLGTDLIRLQCYEGLDVHSAVYEWNYQKQLLSIKIQEKSTRTESEKEAHIFGEEFLLRRPLLQSITTAERPAVLLIDEIDRADEEFEAFLLELLSAFQISIPEMGTIKAKHRPLVVLTSNRTRELSDALKRRCLYHWVDFPDAEKELKIVRKHLPQIEDQLLDQIVQLVQAVRQLKLSKTPGIAETIDWARSLVAMGCEDILDPKTQLTLGALLKSTQDIQLIQQQELVDYLAS